MFSRQNFDDVECQSRLTSNPPVKSSVGDTYSSLELPDSTNVGGSTRSNFSFEQPKQRGDGPATYPSLELPDSSRVVNSEPGMNIRIRPNGNQQKVMNGLHLIFQQRNHEPTSKQSSNPNENPEILHMNFKSNGQKQKVMDGLHLIFQQRNHEPTSKQSSNPNENPEISHMNSKSSGQSNNSDLEFEI